VAGLTLLGRRDYCADWRRARGGSAAELRAVHHLGLSVRDR